MRVNNVEQVDNKTLHKKKMHSSFVNFFITAVSVILMLCVTFAFVIFKTDGFMVIDDTMFSTTVTRPANTTSSVALISQIEDVKNGDTNLPGLSEFQYLPSSGDWYSEPPDYNSSTVLTTLSFSGGEVSLYTSPPWGNASYVYNWSTAAEDVLNQINTQCNYEIPLRYAISYESSGASTATYNTQVQTIDNINCLSVALPPSAVDKEYCNAFTRDNWYKSSTASTDKYYGAEKKFCVILEDKSSTGSYVYLPVFCGDAKGHTFPGGAIQTHIRLSTSAQSADGPFNLKIGDLGVSGEFTWSALSDLFDKPVSSEESSNLNAYFAVNLELCHANSSDKTLLSNYKPVAVVGF